MAKDSIKVRLPGLGGQGAVTAAHIAATAAEINAQVVTFKTKHFPMFKDVVQPYKRH